MEEKISTERTFRGSKMWLTELRPSSFRAVVIYSRIMVIAESASGDMVSKSPVACSIEPMLSVRNGARAVEFYKNAFGATEVFHIEDPSGSVVSRLSVEGAEFWVADESPEHGNFSPESLGGGSVRMILTVADPDAVF